MNRSVGLCILFSILTCGLYSIYWFYKITEELNFFSEDHSISPELALLLSFVTCGLFTIFWSYKMGKSIFIAQEKMDIFPKADDSVMYLILSIFGLTIISCAIMQSHINKMASIRI